MNNNLDNLHSNVDFFVERSQKERLLNQQGRVLWFTGLSGSGKTTIATDIEKKLCARGFLTMVLDGDNVRLGLNKDLGFSHEDRKENIRRIAEVAKLNCQSGLITLCAFISPTIEIRTMAKTIVGENDFTEIFIDTPLEVCEERDPNGLYRKARSGEIQNFTGISSPFEPPLKPDIIIQTAKLLVNDCSSIILNYLGIE